MVKKNQAALLTDLHTAHYSLRSPGTTVPFRDEFASALTTLVVVGKLFGFVEADLETCFSPLTPQAS